MLISIEDNGVAAQFEGETLAILRSSAGGGWQGVGFVDMALGRDGRCAIRQNGVQFGVCLDPRGLEYRWASASARLTEDSFLVFEPGGDYTGRWSDAYRQLVLSVAPETIERTFHLPLASVRIEPQFVPAHARAAAAHLLAAVSADLEDDSPNSAMLAQSVATSLLLALAKVPRRLKRRITNLSCGQAQALRDFIADELTATLSLQDLADKVGLSVGHLVRAFKATFGVTPHRYILRERIARAESLIRAQQSSLAQIADACGFSDQSQMSRTFRQMMGYTPRDVLAAELPCPTRPIGDEP